MYGLNIKSKQPCVIWYKDCQKNTFRMSTSKSIISNKLKIISCSLRTKETLLPMIKWFHRNSKEETGSWSSISWISIKRVRWLQIQILHICKWCIL